MLLQAGSLPEVFASGAAFARKVDLARRPEVVRLLDAEVDRTRSSGAASAEPLDPAGAAQ
jgi:hypothetical protein